MTIRRETIKFSKKIARERKKYEEELVRAFKTAEQQLSASETVNEDEVINSYNRAKEEYESYESYKTRGAMIRSKAKWVENGEKNTKYFLSLEKHNQEIKHIKSLNKDDIEIRDDKEILKYIKEYYTDIYSQKLDVRTDEETFKFFDTDTILDNNLALHLDSHITEEEIFESVKNLPKGKTPGSDGLSPEFYVHFWPVLKGPFMMMLNDVFINERLTIDQRRGIISLIPKQDKDLKLIKNWRPISILNTDYKIITKTLSNRLKPILPDLISEDQNGFVLGRLIGQNIRIVKDIIDYCKNKNINGYLALLDFEKAFDSLNWSFIEYTLKSFNFGPNFIRWIKLLYKDISSSVCNNGHISESFKLARGIRQGCPISAFIFILCAELLAIKIKNSLLINGITLGDHDYKILQFADDTALILDSIDSLNECLKILDNFYTCSGLKLNKAKTIVITLGNVDKDEAKISLDEIGLHLNTETFRYLGIWFDDDDDIMEYKNFRHRLENIENLLKIWYQRDLSLKGKITVIKTLAMSQLIFPLSMLTAPKWVVDSANTMFLRFLWNCKPHRVSTHTIEKQISDGGLKMINVDAMARALKASWMAKIYSNKHGKWTAIPKLYFDKCSFEDMCLTRFDEKYLPADLPSFYKQCLIIINEMRPSEPESAEEILNEKLWYNTNIRINKKPIFYPDWYMTGIKNIGDLLDNHNNMLSPEDLQIKYGLVIRPFFRILWIKECYS
jgi:hypothetical protein